MKRRILLGLWLALAADALLAGRSFDSSVAAVYATIGRETDRGTGFWIDSEGLLVTAYHVILGASEITIFDHANVRHGAVTVEAIDGSCDLVLLRIAGAGRIGSLPLAPDPPDAQQAIIVSGYPRGLPTQTLRGTVSSSSLLDSTQLSDIDGHAIFQASFRVFMLDLTIYGGMSGAPVLDSTGQVLGVIQGSLNEGGALAWAIDRSHITALLNQRHLGQEPSAIATWPALLGNRSLLRRFVSRHMRIPEAPEAIGKIVSDFRELHAMNQNISIAAGVMATSLQGLSSALIALRATEQQSSHPWQSVGLDIERALLAQNLDQLKNLSRNLARRAQLRERVWAFAGDNLPRLEEAAVPPVLEERKARDIGILRNTVAAFASLSPERAVGVDVDQLVANLDRITSGAGLTFGSSAELKSLAETVQAAATGLESLGPSSSVAFRVAAEEEQAFGSAIRIFLRYKEYFEFPALKL